MHNSVPSRYWADDLLGEDETAKPVAPVPAVAPALDPDFAKLDLPAKLDRASHAAIDYKMALITSTDPTSDDVPRIKAALSAAQSILTTSVRVNETALRVRTESRQGEVRRKVHLETIRTCTERGLYRSGALERYEELTALGMPDAMAMVHAEFYLATAPAVIASEPRPAIEARAVTDDQTAVITLHEETAPSAPDEHAEAARPAARPTARPNNYDAPEQVRTKAESDRFMNAPFDQPEPKSYAPGRYKYSR